VTANEKDRACWQQDTGPNTRSEVDSTESNRTYRQDISNREVDWYSVAKFAEPLLARFTSLPLPGTPQWCSLLDTDPAKLTACINVARFWAFDAACRQEAMADAAEAIWEAADWTAIRQALQRRSKAVADGVYIPRRSA